MDVFKEMTMLSLEQATVLPYLSYRLAMDGMRVIRLEHPVYGDPNRMIGENRLGEERMNTYFLAINAGKEAVTLNLASPEGKDLLKELIVKLHVDIFATNQLPRNYEKLGIAGRSGGGTSDIVVVEKKEYQSRLFYSPTDCHGLIQIRMEI